VLFGRVPQQLGIVAIDGVPINANGSPAPAIEWSDHIGVPPGGASNSLSPPRPWASRRCW
jgi:hypothetical protein